MKSLPFGGMLGHRPESAIPSPEVLLERQNILRQYFAAIGEVLEEEGLSRRTRLIMEDSGVTPEELAKPTSGLTFGTYNQVVHDLLEASALPELGLRIGAKKGSKALGVIGIGMVTAIDLAMTFGFAPLATGLGWNRHLQFTLLREGPWAIARYEMDWGPASPMGRAALEDCLLHCLGVLGEVRPDLDFSACEIRMRGPAPPHSALYASFFPCPVTFMQTENELRLPVEWLDRSPVLSNQTVASYCQNLGRELVDGPLRELTVRARVQAAIQDLYPNLHPTLYEVAERLEMTERALQNHLSREHTSLRQMLYHHRLILARKYLRDTRMPIKEIAFRLGFAQIPSFYRAFTRETGRTPDQYRAG